jgi:hypothetical protein
MGVVRHLVSHLGLRTAAILRHIANILLLLTWGQCILSVVSRLAFKWFLWNATPSPLLTYHTNDVHFCCCCSMMKGTLHEKQCTLSAEFGVNVKWFSWNSHIYHSTRIPWNLFAVVLKWRALCVKTGDVLYYISSSIRGSFFEVHVYSSAVISYKRGSFRRNRSILKGSLHEEQRNSYLYVGFNSRDFTETPYMVPCPCTLQTIYVLLPSFNHEDHFHKQQCTFFHVFQLQFKDFPVTAYIVLCPYTIQRTYVLSWSLNNEGHFSWTIKYLLECISASTQGIFL